MATFEVSVQAPRGSVHRNSTFAKITFCTFEHGVVYGSGSPGDSVFGGKQQVLMTRVATLVGDIQQFQTTKPLAGNGGSFSVTCKGKVYGDPELGGKPWSDVLIDGDWVDVGVVKNGTEYHIMLGRIDAVSVSVQAGGGGEADVTVTISGRDLTAPAIDTPLYFNPYDPRHNNAAGSEMIRLFGDSFSGRPHEAVPKILTRAMSDNAVNFGHPPKVPPGVFQTQAVKWSEGIDITSRVGQCRGFLFAPNLLNGGQVQSLWALANQYANPALNEMWLDTDPAPVNPERGRNGYLNFRERPFVNPADGDDSPWFRLVSHEVPLSSVQAINLTHGRNRINHITYVGVFSSMFQQDAAAVAPPAFNEDSVARWGLRMMEPTSMYLSEESRGGFDNWTSENRKTRDLIVAWNALNPRYWDGVIALAEMRPEIRVGQKLILTGGPPAGYPGFPRDNGDPNEAMTFYVEAIQHTWSAGESPIAQTQIQVTQGYVERKRLPDIRQEMAYWSDVTPTSGTRDASTLGDYPRPSTSTAVTA